MTTETTERTVTAELTLTTCSIACWMAREESCRCSCGGRSHGVLLQDGAEQPRRNSMIQGHRYVLGAIEAGRAASRLSWDFRATLDRATYGRLLRTGGSMMPLENEPGSVVWIKKASAAQLAKWPEVAEWSEGVYQQQITRHREFIERCAASPSGYVPRFAEPQRGQRPYLVWVREDVAEKFDAFAS